VIEIDSPHDHEVDQPDASIIDSLLQRLVPELQGNRPESCGDPALP